MACVHDWPGDLGSYRIVRNCPKILCALIKGNIDEKRPAAGFALSLLASCL